MLKCRKTSTSDSNHSLCKISFKFGIEFACSWKLAEKLFLSFFPLTGWCAYMRLWSLHFKCRFYLWSYLYIYFYFPELAPALLTWFSVVLVVPYAIEVDSRCLIIPLKKKKVFCSLIIVFITFPIIAYYEQLHGITRQQEWHPKNNFWACNKK